jgi:urea transporter
MSGGGLREEDLEDVHDDDNSGGDDDDDDDNDDDDDIVNSADDDIEPPEPKSPAGVDDDDDEEEDEDEEENSANIADHESEEMPPPPEPKNPAPGRRKQRTGYLVIPASKRQDRFVAAADAMDSVVERAQAKSRWWMLWTMVNSTNEPFVNWLASHSKAKRWAMLLEFLDGSCLRSFSQVVFINNSLSGLVIFVSLLAYDYVLGLLALLAAFTASLAALIIGFNYGSIRTGLFGYSAVLCGCAMSATDGSIGARVGLTVIAAVISTALSVFFGTALATWRVAPLTLPFNVSAVIMFVSLKLQFAGGGAPPPVDEVLVGDAVWHGSLRGVAQIFLVNNEWVGIAMLLGVALSSRYLSLALLLGSATGVAIAFAVGAAVRDIDDGLFSFNASLGCAAIWFFYVLTWRSVILGVLCAAGTVLLRLSLAPPSFTLPFCLAALTFLFFNNSARQLYSIQLPDLSTPEAHRLAFIRSMAEKKAEKDADSELKQKVSKQTSV